MTSRIAMSSKKALRVAFGCQARVGKDTSVDILREMYPNSRRVSFADPLYEIHDFAQKRCRFPQQKDRRFLQWVGTDWARQQDPDVWVHLAEEEIERIASYDPETSIFISDLRFPNEMEMLRRQGFKLVRVMREYAQPGSTADSSYVSNVQKSHASENGLVDLPPGAWDHVIVNDGTINDLRENLKAMIDKFHTVELH